MTNKIPRFAIAILLLSAAFLSAQSDAAPSTPPPQSAPRPRQEPCWRQAGLSQTVIEQRREIERDAHSQVAAVCENSSLTPQQKQRQTREIRQQAQQKVDALITPEQQNTLRACQQQRSGNRTHPEGQPGGGCGNLAGPQGHQAPSNGNTGESPQPPQN